MMQMMQMQQHQQQQQQQLLNVMQAMNRPEQRDLATMIMDGELWAGEVNIARYVGNARAVANFSEVEARQMHNALVSVKASSTRWIVCTTAVMVGEFCAVMGVGSIEAGLLSLITSACGESCAAGWAGTTAWSGASYGAAVTAAKVGAAVVQPATTLIAHMPWLLKGPLMLTVNGTLWTYGLPIMTILVAAYAFSKNYQAAELLPIAEKKPPAIIAWTMPASVPTAKEIQKNGLNGIAMKKIARAIESQRQVRLAVARAMNKMSWGLVMGVKDGAQVAASIGREAGRAATIAAATWVGGPQAGAAVAAAGGVGLSSRVAGAFLEVKARQEEEAQPLAQHRRRRSVRQRDRKREKVGVVVTRG